MRGVRFDEESLFRPPEFIDFPAEHLTELPHADT